MEDKVKRIITCDLDGKVDCADPECGQPCPVAGNGCVEPFEVASVGFQVNGTTEGLDDALSAPANCADIYAGKGEGSPDAIYHLKVAQTGLYSVSIDADQTDFNTILYLIWTCETAPSVCPGASDVPGTGGEQLYFLAKEGEDQYVVVDGVLPEDKGAYGLSISFLGGVEVDCGDGIDDDEDGDIDCADPDCSSVSICSQ